MKVILDAPMRRVSSIHPASWAVHELGLDPDGRVYFTMKLVKGRTLKEIFVSSPRARKTGPNESARRVAQGLRGNGVRARQGRHPSRLEAWQHHGGKFGEVHVMDWGLARILDKADDKDIRIRQEVRGDQLVFAPRSARTSRNDLRVAVVHDERRRGRDTSVHASREAAGRVNEVGPHSDVYAVGAPLYT